MSFDFSECKLLTYNRNPTTTRLWSPDELTSNKLDVILEFTGRNFQWDPESRAKGGRVIEILSEHTCQGMLQGYTLTGRTGIFPSYESFLGIIQTMMVQYSKFCKMVSLSSPLFWPILRRLRLVSTRGELTLEA